MATLRHLRFRVGWHFLVTVALAILGCGCSGKYRVTLTNNQVITTHSKPRLNEVQSAYEFKDAQGKRTSVPVFKVKEIEPL